MRVEVYWNVARCCFSVRPLEGELKGRVAAQLQAVELVRVQLIVQPAGRARVLKEGRKNVHAFARGEMVTFGQTLSRETWLGVHYNPYEEPTFLLNGHGPNRDVRVARAFRGVSAGDRPVCLALNPRRN